ncbi:caspase-3-like isoform X1 [Mytilus galloprovincialis]|uniref:caspase-3-like isoform X1 n=1 Tax=Mytilus galloprovincialis TaxID=29158 RepID=UPI003F7C81F7
MDERSRTILRKGRTILIKGLCDIPGICDKLFAYGVLTEGMMSEITSEHTREQQARALLDILPRRGQTAYDYFHQALVDTHSQDLADVLKPELASRPELSKAKTLEETPQRYDRTTLQHAASVGSPIIDPPSLFSVGSIDIHSTDTVPPFTPETVEPMKIKMLKCYRQQIISNNPDCYSMDGNPRGKLIIINIMSFDNHGIPSRDKQAHDLSATSLSLLFKQLKFKIDIKTDINKKELLDLITAEQQSRETYDCFAMVILSHGLGDLIFMKDGEPLKMQNIMDQFDTENCPKLKGKPKLFFIHACPSDSGDQDNTEMSNIFPLIHEDHHTLTKADIFLARATKYDPIVSNTESKGFWFIQAFVHIMKYRGHHDHLLDIMTKVNGLAREDDQLVESMNTLTRSLYFFPD